ncbi:MAG: hypothetical protein AB1714_30995 [Acidobacteriota bacterium]
MIEDMQLPGLSPRTQQPYARAVGKLAEHHHRSPDLITQDQTRLDRRQSGQAQASTS